MKADERQRQILVRARADGRVEVGSLAADLDVAEETVRRDLRELVERGVLQRVHGGAYPVESAGFESNIKHRRPRWSRRSAGSPRRPPSGCTAPRRSTSTRASPRSSSPRRPPGDAAHGGHLLAARRRRARGAPRTSPCCCSAAGCAAGPWRPSTTGRCGCSATWSSTWPSSAPTASPASTAYHPRPGRGRGQGRSRRALAPRGSSSACTPSSAPQLLPVRRDLGLRGPGHRHRAEPGEARRFSVLGPQVVRA